MFNSSWDAVERGIGYLAKIIDLIVKLLTALNGGSSTTTTAPSTTAAAAEGEQA